MISASLVKELREKTGAGMLDCKKALEATNADIDAAVDWLREKGISKAAKKADRIAAEGIAAILIDGNNAAIVEVNSETDFVAKNDEFKSMVDTILKTILKSDKDTVEELLAESTGEGTVEELITSKTATIGEKLSVRRFAKITGDCVASYIHAGGKIGVILASEGAADVKEALTNIAMQIAAMNPEYISRDEIAQAEVDKMREIIVDSSLNDPASLPKPILNALIEKACTDKVWSEEDIAIYEEKKSNMNFLFNFLSKEAKAALAGLAMEDKANIATNKIFNGAIEGRVSKQLKDICLLDQTYVKAEDGKQTVGQYIAAVAKEAGAEVSLKKFVRFETGEGIEKKQEDFAAEVAAQMAGN